MNLYLVKFESRWILNERLFYYFVYLKVSSSDLEKQKQKQK